MRSTSAKHAKWCGETEVNQQLRSTTCGSVSSTVFVAGFVRLLFRGFSQLDVVPGAGTLAFAIRSGVNLILLLARIQGASKMPRIVQGSSVGYSLECHADRRVHAGKRVFRLCNMRSSEQTLSVSVPCSVCSRFLDLIGVVGSRNMFMQEALSHFTESFLTHSLYSSLLMLLFV